ncbi:MAG: hypothetical protein U9R75_05510 [Candidatus Thermoplasmatota archaeon]|nr:hypothetical protein [Candidatus Thermoplasmatota archaeon]
MAPKEDDISRTAPPFSLGKIAMTMKEKGFVGALEDPEQGPHVHLALLIATIFVVSFGIILITKFVM